MKGYMQQQGVHYTQSFSPTISQVSLRIVMTLTSMKGFRSWDLDATSAFVSAPLPEGETVHMEQIPGFPLPKGKCLKLKRTLYDLVQTPLAFYKLCCEVYISVGYMNISWNIDGTPISSRSHTHPSHTQNSRLLTSSLLLGVPGPHGTVRRSPQCIRDT